MKLTFLGADHEVTGSCHFLQAAGLNILVDCGMEQGNDVYENQELPIAASDVDCILLTHAHIDHSGLIPLMYVNGFRGQVYSTSATAQLCEIMLRDSAHIQMFEAEWRNRKAARSGGKLKEFVPLYDMDAAVNVCKQFVGCEYDRVYDIAEGIKIRFTDVGHLLGSASIEVWATEKTENGDVTEKIVFSGDIGNINKPIIKDPKHVRDADYVVMESTYGNRSHGGTPNYVEDLTDIFKRTFERGGNVVIPSFAVGRTQELLYIIRKIKEDNLVGRDFDVYMDSPLAIEATNIFIKNVESCFDDDAVELVRKGINPLSFPGLKYATTGDESKQINFDPNPKVIISSSGMCEAGRIRHHLKHNLWREECTILFVGYQAMGTLGRRLIEGEKNVKLFGEPIEVKARIESLHGISGHADMNGLLKWLGAFKEAPQRVFVVHGEDTVTEEFAKTVEEKFGYQAYAPFPCSEADLLTNEILSEGVKIPVKAKKPAQRKADAAFERLVAAGRRLLDVIYKNEGLANKDKAKFESQINNLSDKWDI